MGLAGKIKNSSSGLDYPPQQQSTGQNGSGGYGVAAPQQQSTGPYGSGSHGVAAPQQKTTGPYGSASNGKSSSSGYDYPPQQQSTGTYGSASNGKSSSSGYDYPSQQQFTGPYGSAGYGNVPPQQQPTGSYGSASWSKNSNSGYDYPSQQQSTGPYRSGSYGHSPAPQQPNYGPYGSANKVKNSSSNGYDYPPQQQSTGPYGSGSHGATSPPQQPAGSYGSDFYYGIPSAQNAYPSPSAPPWPQQHYGADPHDHTRPPSLVASSPHGVQGQTPPYPGHVQTPPATQGMYSHPAVGTGALQSSLQPVLAQKLQSIIQANGLQAFYDQGRFQTTLQRVAAINFAEIAAQWKIDRELAYDLAPLALYDIMFYCDDSGSMAFEENGERIDDLRFLLSKVAGIASRFDDDGIRVRFMNSDVNGDGINSAAAVEQLISRVRFSGMTPLGTNLERKIVQPFVVSPAMSSMAKPVLAIIITDGEPSGEGPGKIRQVIQHAKDALMRTRYGAGALAVQIAQVGKDAKTQKFLESLDKDPVVGGMIDCTSYYELEEEEFARKGVTLTPELWLLKMCVGAIDPEYDSKDT